MGEKDNNQGVALRIVQIQFIGGFYGISEAVGRQTEQRARLGPRRELRDAVVGRNASHVELVGFEKIARLIVYAGAGFGMEEPRQLRRGVRVHCLDPGIDEGGAHRGGDIRRRGGEGRRQKNQDEAAHTEGV